MAFVTKKDTGYKTVIKGFLTGGTQAAITYPTEFVKTQLQLQSKTEPQFNGIIDCFKKTISSTALVGFISELLFASLALASSKCFDGVHTPTWLAWHAMRKLAS
jgi:solute carrier family 25 citrate transporter 1